MLTVAREHRVINRVQGDLGCVYQGREKIQRERVIMQEGAGTIGGTRFSRNSKGVRSRE